MPAEAALDILAVDDESNLRETLRRAFNRQGHRVVTASNGRAAIARLFDRSFTA